MAKELERAGITTTIISTLVPLAERVGPNRIVGGKAIPHPVGNPTLPPEEERTFRRRLVQKALESLQTETEGQLVLRATD